VEAGLGGPQRDAERARDIGQRHSEEVVHHDDGPRFGVEVTQRLVQDIAVDDRGREVADDRIVDRGQFDFDRPVTATTQDIDAGVDDKLAEPGVESLGIAKPAQVTPCVEKSILDRVMSKVGVSEDQSGRGVQPGDGRSGEHGEGVMIAPLRLLDEVPLLHDSPWFSDRLSHSSSMAVG
jgi:hypothetical protein